MFSAEEMVGLGKKIDDFVSPIYLFQVFSSIALIFSVAVALIVFELHFA
jgi:hypothetical protein